MAKRSTKNTSIRCSQAGKTEDSDYVLIRLPSEARYPAIIYVRDEAYEVIFKKRFSCYGETDFEKKTITIKSGLPRRALMSTFIHEILHALDYEHGADLKHKTVYLLELALMELLTDNFL